MANAPRVVARDLQNSIGKSKTAADPALTPQRVNTWVSGRADGPSVLGLNLTCALSRLATGCVRMSNHATHITRKHLMRA